MLRGELWTLLYRQMRSQRGQGTGPVARASDRFGRSHRLPDDLARVFAGQKGHES